MHAADSYKQSASICLPGCRCLFTLAVSSTAHCDHIVYAVFLIRFLDFCNGLLSSPLILASLIHGDDDDCGGYDAKWEVYTIFTGFCCFVAVIIIIGLFYLLNGTGFMLPTLRHANKAMKQRTWVCASIATT